MAKINTNKQSYIVGWVGLKLTDDYFITQSTKANKQLDTPMFVVVRCVNISELRSNQLLRQCHYNIKALLIVSGDVFYDVPRTSLDSKVKI